MVEPSAYWPTEASLNRLSFYTLYYYYILCFWVVLELSSAFIVVDLSWAEFVWKEANRTELVQVHLALAELISNELRFFCLS